MLTCGRLAEAKAAGDFLVHLFENQPKPDRYLFQLAEPDTGRVLEMAPPGSVSVKPIELYERVDNQTPGQRYYHPGI